MLKVNCILAMPKSERCSKNSDRKETTIEEWEIVRESVDLAQDHCHLPPRLVVLKMVQKLKFKKSLTMVSITAPRNLALVLIVMRVLPSVLATMRFK